MARLALLLAVVSWILGAGWKMRGLGFTPNRLLIINAHPDGCDVYSSDDSLGRGYGCYMSFGEDPFGRPDTLVRCADQYDPKFNTPLLFFDGDMNFPLSAFRVGIHHGLSITLAALFYGSLKFIYRRREPSKDGEPCED